ITGPDGAPARLLGRIDRIAVGETEVLFADFKTGRPPGGAPPAQYLAQMAAYRDALAPIFPGRRLRGLLIWLSPPRMVETDGAADG
ncbi:MAG: PD-(D/E)XK nuclease family protein, partial [Hyphomicrobiales bacterium]|nr:PD-(D/E)XK nuclease family protein [Hyphomicrobiales bacterium]